MNGFTRAACLVLCLLLIFFMVPAVARQADPGSGQITDLVFTPKFGASPGTDQFTASGSYVLGSGSTGIHLPQDAVVVSFDGGRFIQAIPSNSFVAIAGGWRFTSTNPGVQLMKVMTNGTFTITAKSLDLTGSNPSMMGVFSFSVGANIFSATPNSPPVAKIVGPASALVGSTVVLDGSQSTDFNGQPLSSTWAIVSQPLGSNVSLSTSTNAATSFIPTRNGAYVIRLTNNDGTVDGVPALITVMASGEELPPPPAPGPNNGLIALGTDLSSYVVGDSATLSLHVNVPVGNAENRYFFAATFDDQPVALTTVTNNTDYSYTVGPFNAAQGHSFKVTQYVEKTDTANRLNAAIANFNSDILAINKALLYETEAEAIAKLQAQKAFDLEQIANAQDQLVRNRTKVAETAVLNFTVN